MLYSIPSMVAVLGLTLLPPAHAAVTSSKATTSTPACSQAPYKDLLYISSYSKAASFCSSKYPPSTSYTTTTVTVTQGAGAQSVTITKPTSSAAPVSTCDKACTAWSSITKQAASSVSTLCSCIETTPTVTVTATATATTSTTTTAAATQITPPRAECTSQQTDRGSFRCGCYYSTSCGYKYDDIGDVLDRGFTASQDDCGARAGDALARYYRYNLVTGQCDLFNSYHSGGSDEDWVSGIILKDALPCRGYSSVLDPWRAGCGCAYDEKCDVCVDDGIIISNEYTRWYGECFHKCDLALNCVAVQYIESTCTLYSNVTSTLSGFGCALGVRTSCNRPCKS